MPSLHKLRFMFFSGKNPKWRYYLTSYIRVYFPASVLRKILKRKLKHASRRPDYEYMISRRDYYNKLSPGCRLKNDCPEIGRMEMTRQKVYYLDTYRYARYFSPELKLRLLPGDIIHVPEEPSVTKSRPLVSDNSNSVLLKLDRVRHFIFVKKDISFEDKLNMAIFRGRIDDKDVRLRFMKKYFGHPMIDAGDVARHNAEHPEWLCPKLTLPEQLKYKFIMSLEGNDVASNLKWIMSSNSIAVMPRPTCETWFMEGTLIPNYHYIEISNDLSDLPERLNYYINHPEECKRIIANAHEYVNQFRDSKREDMISLMVLEKYFRATGQL